jgi:AcrR family transcriptional regulator
MAGTRPRSAAGTRAAILAAARARFGAEGYERTTLRAIAGDAGVDAAMVIRYFRSKEELFATAAEFHLGMPDLRGVAVEDVVAFLMPHLFAVWEGDTPFFVLLRASVTNETARQRMEEVFVREVAPTFAAVCPDHPAQRAALFGAGILGLALSRYVLKTPPLVAMSQEEVVAWIAPVLRRYLFDPAPPGVPRG